MKTANIGEAKAHFSELVKQAESGEEIQIMRNGVPVVRLVPEKNAKKRYFAPDDGLGFVADDFNAPLPAEILEQFNK